MANVNVSLIKGLGFTQVLFLLFLTLKLTGVITWSWWFVTMPLWAYLAIMVGVCATVMLGAGLLIAFLGFILGIVMVCEATWKKLRGQK